MVRVGARRLVASQAERQCEGKSCSFSGLALKAKRSPVSLHDRPIREGQARLAARYRSFLTNSANLSIHPLDVTVADEAVRLRAHNALRTPDAIQLATAVCSGADHFLTNDRRLAGVADVSVLVVADLA